MTRTPATDGPALRRRLQAFGLVLAVTWPLALALGAFALTVTGQQAYMSDVAKYGPGLAWVGPLVIEGTLVAALLALLLIGLAGWSRLWVWTTLILASVASVVGNVVVASVEGLPGVAIVTRGSWPVWVILCETVSVIVVRKLWPATVASPSVSTPPDRWPDGKLVTMPEGWSSSDSGSGEHDGTVSSDSPKTPLAKLHLVNGKPKARRGGRGQQGKITDALVMDVTDALANGPFPASAQTAVGERHGVSRSTVRRVVRGLSAPQGGSEANQ